MYSCKYCLKQYLSHKALAGHTKHCQANHSILNVLINVETNPFLFDDNVLKEYLGHKFGYKCSQCGWARKNPSSNSIPVEMNHKDGDSDNKYLSNLELLCPNCHSLTGTYKVLNLGNGREYRRKRALIG